MMSAKHIICALLLVFSLLGVSMPLLAADHKDDKMKVVTSFTVIADIARHVAGDAAVVESVTKPGAEIHDYQPTPQDIVRAGQADLILWNGMNLERWFERFMQDVKTAKSIIVSEGIEPISIYEGPYDGKPNPHAWMSVENALVYVENIRKAFVENDPANAEIYNENARKYAEQIRAIRDDLHQSIAAIPQDRKYLVTSEGAFSYLAKDLGLKEIYLWPINADQQGTPQQVKKVIDAVREHNVPVVFSESTVSDKPARQVAEESGALYGGVLYVDSLSEADGPVPSYLDLLKVTTKTIAEGFAKALNAQDSGTK